MVGAGHPTKSDTLNRALLIGHNADGTHKAGIIQIAHASISSVVSGSTLAVEDDTIPQNTEGFEVMTCSITPNASANKLLIQANICIGYQNADLGYGIIALFQDSIANALAAVQTGRSLYAAVRSLTHKMNAGTTSPITFKIRVGGTWAGTYYVNSQMNASSRFGGGVSSSTLTIIEYA